MRNVSDQSRDIRVQRRARCLNRKLDVLFVERVAARAILHYIYLCIFRSFLAHARQGLQGRSAGTLML